MGGLLAICGEYTSVSREYTLNHRSNTGNYYYYWGKLLETPLLLDNLLVLPGNTTGFTSK